MSNFSFLLSNEGLHIPADSVKYNQPEETERGVHEKFCYRGKGHNSSVLPSPGYCRYFNHDHRRQLAPGKPGIESAGKRGWAR